MLNHGLMKVPRRHLFRHLSAACAVLLALGLMAGHAAAEPKRVPKPHGYPLHKPPGNVAADAYRALFGGAVWVGFAGGVDSFPDHPDDTIEVIYTGRDGRFATCHFGPPGRHYSHGNNRWEMRRSLEQGGNRRIPMLFNGRDISGNNGGFLLPVYNARTGGLNWYAVVGKYWFGDSHGHLQKRLPRAVWTACPKFPSAKSLGVGVNEKQTAITYFDLVKQDRGKRILRPDLMTKNPIEYLNRKTGQWESRGRRRGK